jgi:hypothetical protein
MKTKPQLNLSFYLVMLMLPVVVIRAPAQTEISQARADRSSEPWHISVSPYIWFAGLNGNVTVNAVNAPIRESFEDVADNLKVGALGLIDLRKGKVGMVNDLMYIRVGEQTQVPLKQTLLPFNITVGTFTYSPAMMYEVVSEQRFSADIIGGLRYYHVGTHVSINRGEESAANYGFGENWVDAIGGARFRLQVAPRIDAFLFGDGGGGGSNMTWQLGTGVGYRWPHNVSTQIGYRCLRFHRQDVEAAGFDITEQGLIVGTTFHLR